MTAFQPITARMNNESTLIVSKSSPLEPSSLIINGSKHDYSQSDDFAFIRNNNSNKHRQRASQRMKLTRRNTEPPHMHSYINTKTNNYYQQIRFSRHHDNDFINEQQQKQKEVQRKFPTNIKDFNDFRRRYRFIMINGAKEVIGSGATSRVYKAHSFAHRSAKFAVKVTQYKDNANKQQIIKENELLHRFGNGMYIKDIYDDAANKRLVFVLPFGKDLKLWWNGMRNKFRKERPKKQEWILKKIILQILLSLKEIHNAGYIHHDLKPQNILVTTNKKRRKYANISEEWIDEYSFHIIDFGLSTHCAMGQSVKLNANEIKFGTIGYNAWELMQNQRNREYDHSIDLYALGITVCDLIFGQHVLREWNNFKKDQENFCSVALVERWNEENEYFENEIGDEEFFGFTEAEVYRHTLDLKCEHWRRHFSRTNGVSAYNGDESCIRSVIIQKLQLYTPYTTRFKNFISNLIRDDKERRISSAQNAINHDLFYNV